MSYRHNLLVFFEIVPFKNGQKLAMQLGQLKTGPRVNDCSKVIYGATLTLQG